METWPSGRRHLTANEAGDKTPRGFESRRLRNSKQRDPKTGLFVLSLLSDGGIRRAQAT